MTLKELNEFIHRESTRPEIEYEDYEIVIDGPPNQDEIAVYFNKGAVGISDKHKIIFIWIG
jgi:hypothetical protein